MKRCTVILLTLTLGLAACHDHPVTPSVQIVTVEKPIAIQPITKDQVPALPAQMPPRPADARAAADLALAARCDAIAFVIKAYPLLLLAAGEPPVQAPDFPECRQ